MDLTCSWILRRSIGAVIVRDTASDNPAAKTNLFHMPEPSSGNSVGMERLSPTSKTCNQKIFFFYYAPNMRSFIIHEHWWHQGSPYTGITGIGGMMSLGEWTGKHTLYGGVIVWTTLANFIIICSPHSQQLTVTSPATPTRLFFHEDTSSPMFSAGLRMTWCKNSPHSTVMELSWSSLTVRNNKHFLVFTMLKVARYENRNIQNAHLYLLVCDF